MFGVMILVPLFAGLVRGESALDAGWLLAPMGLGAMLTMSVSGRLADRFGGRWFVVGGVLGVLAGTLALTGLSPAPAAPRSCAPCSSSGSATA